MNVDDRLLVQLCPCVHPHCMCEGSCPENLELDDFCPTCSHPVHEHGNLRKLTSEQRAKLLESARHLNRLNMSPLDDRSFDKLMQRAHHIAEIRSILDDTVVGTIFSDYPLPPPKLPPYELPTLSEIFDNFTMLFKSSDPSVKLPHLLRTLSGLLNDFKIPQKMKDKDVSLPNEELERMSRLWMRWKYEGYALVDCFGPRFFYACFFEIRNWLSEYNGKSDASRLLLNLVEVLGNELGTLLGTPLIDPNVSNPDYVKRWYPAYPLLVDLTSTTSVKPASSIEGEFPVVQPSRTLKSEDVIIKTEDLDSVVTGVERKRLSSALEAETVEPPLKMSKPETTFTDVDDVPDTDFCKYIPELVLPENGSSEPPTCLRKQYKSRDERAKELEDAGKLSFRLITNDGTPQTLQYLYNYSRIIFEMLPNMPKEYIVRLVFDYTHRVLLIEQVDESLKAPKKKLIGGVCFRPHSSQKLIEIVFLAIHEPIRKIGFGTRLMNQMKHWAISNDYDFILTYADDSAIGYFQKQGFTQTITTERDRYGGWIKDYNGATLMECILYKQFDWLHIPEMLNTQMKTINERMRELKYPQRIQLPAKKAIRSDVYALRRSNRTIFGIRNTDRRSERYCTPIYPRSLEIPLLRASDISTEHRCIESKLTADADVVHLHIKLEEIYDELNRYNEAKCAKLFSAAVPDHIVPHYYDSVKNPIDLSLVRVRLDSGHYYRSPYMFFADIQRMCENAATFNAKTEYAKIANNMLQKAKKLIPDKLAFLGFKID
ncbi:hypothetical protein P9112_005068 [Eukaryota sp. TZLM1-RC]